MGQSFINLAPVCRYMWVPGHSSPHKRAEISSHRSATPATGISPQHLKSWIQIQYSGGEQGWARELVPERLVGWHTWVTVSLTACTRASGIWKLSQTAVGLSPVIQSFLNNTEISLIFVNLGGRSPNFLKRNQWMSTCLAFVCSTRHMPASSTRAMRKTRALTGHIAPSPPVHWWPKVWTFMSVNFPLMIGTSPHSIPRRKNVSQTCCSSPHINYPALS